MKKLLLALALSVSSVVAQGTKANPARLPDRKIDAAALLADIRGKAPTEIREVLGLLKIRDAKGKRREVPIKWIIKPLEGGLWIDSYQTPISSVIPPEVLNIIHSSGPNRYEFKRDGQPVPEASTNLFIPFGTSDYWLVDFGLEFLHWPNPKHLETEMRTHRPCYVIETRNPNPIPGTYSRVLCWIDTEEGGLIRAEAYDLKDKLLKEFSIRGFKKVEGRWQIKHLEIRNDQTDSKTDLDLDVEIPEANTRPQKEGAAP